MDTKRVFDKICGFLQPSGEHRVGILSTAGKDGTPHATYMGTVASPAIDQLLTMTAPDSLKVMNILENPRVEWLFVDEEREEILYLHGRGKILQEPAEVEAAWKQIPDKSRAYFLSYQDVGIQFLIVETIIDSFEYRVPRQNRIYRVTSQEVRRTLNAN